MMLKSTDLLIALRLAGASRSAWSFEQLASELHLALSLTHRGVQRLKESGLMDRASEQVQVQALRNFIVHGAPYVFPAKVGRVARGVPTASSAPMFAAEFGGPASDPGQNFVWPSAAGDVRGLSIEPLTDAVPEIALRNPLMYARLAAFDAIRAGRARERSAGALVIQSLATEAGAA